MLGIDGPTTVAEKYTNLGCYRAIYTSPFLIASVKRITRLLSFANQHD